MPVFVSGVTKHAAGQPTAFLTVAGSLKLAVSVGISVQYLNGLMLAAGATAATPRQQKSGPGPTLASDAAKRSRRVVPTTSICKSLALRLLMLGSSNGAGRGTVGVGIGANCVALGASPLGEGLVMVEPERRRSSTASTIPTTPTTSAVAVAVAATTTRVVLATCVTVPTPPKQTRASDGYNLITSLAQIRTKPLTN
jgi:hypothetical protein